MDAPSLPPLLPPPPPAALVADHLRLVPATVRRMIRGPAGEHPLLRAAALDESDLLSLGYLGLIHAARTWQPTHRASFQSWAIARIRWALLAALEEGKEVPLCLSLDAPAPGRGEGVPETATLAEVLTDPEANTEAEALAPLLARDVWAAVDASLPARQAQLIRWHYRDGLTFGEISARLGVTRQRAYQLHDTALRTLRGDGRPGG